jgi:hypothetical protein
VRDSDLGHKHMKPAAEAGDDAYIRSSSVLGLEGLARNVEARTAEQQQHTGCEEQERSEDLSKTGV